MTNKLKNYIKEKSISIYALSKKTGVPYSTLNDLCNGKVEIGNCKAGIVKAVADALGTSMDELYELAQNRLIVHSDEYDTDAEVTVKGKRYHAAFEYNDSLIDLDICRVCEENADYIVDLAKWDVEEFIDKDIWG